MTPESASSSYILDANVLIYLQRAKLLRLVSDLHKKLCLIVVEEVWNEVVEEPARSDRQLERDRGNEARRKLEPALERLGLDLGSPGADLYARLTRSGTTNKGERASIGLALNVPGGVFVSGDARAAIEGLDELGGRTILVAEFVRRVSRHTPMTPDDAAALGRHLPRRPTWWVDWAASLAPDVRRPGEP